MTLRILRLSRLGLLASVLLAGCSARPEARMREELFGHSVEHRAIRGWILTNEQPPYLPASAMGERYTVLVFAAIHGNEPRSVDLAEGLLEELRWSPHLLGDRKVVVIPVVNPDGLARRTRVSVNGVDLNRNFPAENWRRRGKRHGDHPGSEPETKALLEAMRRHPPDRILSIHAPLHCINYDGPARELAERMGALCEYPVRENIGYPTPGSFGSWAGHDLGIPVITVELRRDIRADEVWGEMGQATVDFVVSEAAAVERRVPSEAQSR